MTGGKSAATNGGVASHHSAVSPQNSGLSSASTGVAVARIAGKPDLAPAALVVPFYWVLMSLAAAKAVLQLVRQPTYWEKTTHGLDAPTGGPVPTFTAVSDGSR